MSATAILAAAGSGERLGADVPKAFVVLAGRPLLEWSLDALTAAESIDKILVTTPKGSDPLTVSSYTDAVEAVEGGPSRSESVRNALARVETEVVVVHDAARPLATADLFDAVVSRLAGDAGCDCAIAAAPITDTVKEVADEVVERTLDRSRLWGAQTPQAFRAVRLREALSAADSLADATDDAMLVERIGGRVAIHPAPPENIKVTTPLDLRVAGLLLAERSG